MKKPLKQGISFGTLFMIAVTSIVLAGSVIVLSKLKGDTPFNISLNVGDGVIDLKNITSLIAAQDIPVAASVGSYAREGTETENQAAPSTAATAEEESAGITLRTNSTPTTPKPEQRENLTAEPAKPVRFSLTAGGGISIKKGIRQSAYYDDSKKYDFTEVMALLKPAFTGDLNLVAGMNLVMPEKNVGDLITPAALMEMLATDGVDTVSLGFSRCADQGRSGISSTISAAKDAGLFVTGLFDSEEETEISYRIRDINGVKVAVLHYTDTLTATGKKTLQKSGEAWSVPLADADTIRTETERARAAGADVVIVTLSWGKEKAKTPTKAQKTLAQSIADAGADLILGTGSQVVQQVEMLTGTLSNGQSHQTLCAYSLGGLLDDAREDNRVCGLLLHIEMTIRPEGGTVSFDDISCTPTYIWRYKQDSKYYYRAVPAIGDPPDGMDDSQMKSRKRAAANIRKVLDGSPVTVPADPEN